MNRNDNVGLNSFSREEKIPSLHIARRYNKRQPHRMVLIVIGMHFQKYLFFISFKLPTITILILLKVINFYDPPAHNNHQIDRRASSCLSPSPLASCCWPPASHVAINTYQSQYCLSTHANAGKHAHTHPKHIHEYFEMVSNKTKICLYLIFCYKIQPQIQITEFFSFILYPLNLDNSFLPHQINLQMSLQTSAHTYIERIPRERIKPHI